jgi:hypothetical protein
MSKKLKKFLKKYIIHLIIIFVLANSTIALLVFSKAQSTPCMTQSDINSDSRCLYIYHNDIYSKGTKRNPHQGADCGTNVDTSIPKLHFSGNTFSKFNEAKIATFCTGPQPTTPPTAPPTQAPTVAPTIASTVAPTNAPTSPPTITPTNTATTAPATTATSASQATTVATVKPQATKTAEPNKPSATTVTSNTTTSSQTPSPTSNTQITNNSGSSFGEILGRPSGVKTTKKPMATDEVAVKKEFKLTNISKPLTYASVLSVIGSIILILIF